MSGTVRKRGDRWIADVSIDGTRRQASGRTRAEAEAKRKALVAQMLAQPLASAGSGFTIEEARRLSMQIRWANTPYERTAAIYSAASVEFFGRHTPIESIGAPEVEQWRQKLAAINRPATINAKVSAIKAMQSDALLHGHITSKPSMPKQLKAGGHKDRVISDQEQAAMLAFFRDIGQPQAADLLTVLLDTAARWGEMERLRSGDVDLVARRVTFWQTKGGSPRSVPLTTRAFDAVAPHVSPLPGYRVWPYNYGQFRRLFDQAKGHIGLADDEALSIHTTRHTCASRLAAQGVSLARLMRFGGWSSLSAVQRYLHLHTDSLADCVAALES